jgi:hypothetical protein
MEVLSAVTYRLNLPPSWKIHNAFHATVLHPYKETELHRPNFTEAPPDLMEGHEEWEVDNVLASRCTGKKKTLQYLVRWNGFLEAHDSWEPKENLGNTPLKMKEFHDKNPKAIRRMVINPQEVAMESSLLPDISSLCTQFENLSLMSSHYSSPSPATHNAMLAADTEEVAVLEALLHPTTEAPPPSLRNQPMPRQQRAPQILIQMNTFVSRPRSIASTHLAVFPAQNHFLFLPLTSTRFPRITRTIPATVFTGSVTLQGNTSSILRWD